MYEINTDETKNLKLIRFVYFRIPYHTKDLLLAAEKTSTHFLHIWEKILTISSCVWKALSAATQQSGISLRSDTTYTGVIGTPYLH